MYEEIKLLRNATVPNSTNPFPGFVGFFNVYTNDIFCFAKNYVARKHAHKHTNLDKHYIYTNGSLNLFSVKDNKQVNHRTKYKFLF